MKNLGNLIHFFKFNLLRQTIYPLTLLLGGALLTFLLYLPTLRAPFILDDIPKIVDNPQIRSLAQFSESFSLSQREINRGRNSNDPSRPLTYFTYLLNYQMRGLKPGTYHLFNLLLHLFNMFLIFFLIRKISSSAFNISSETIPVLVAILFALHPVQASSVSSVFRRSDLLATFFYLISFYLFIHLLLERSRLFWFASLTAFVLSILSKQSAVTLPLILLLYDFIFVADRNWVKLKTDFTFHGTYWLILFLYLAWRVLYLGGLGDMEAIDRIRTSLTILNNPYVIMKYIQLLLVPKGLCFDHLLIPATSFWEFKIWFSWLFLLSLAVLVIVLNTVKGWKSKVIQFSLLWFFIQLAPTSTFFSTTRLLVENRIYLAGIGLMLAFFSLFFVTFDLDLKKGFFSRDNFLGSLLFLSILILFSIFTWRRNVVYGNPIYLWREVTKLYPYHTLAHSQLGLAYHNKKMYEKGLAAFDRALLLDPNLSEAYYNKGNLYLERDSYDLALNCYSKVMELAPEFPRAYHNAALILARRKQFIEAQTLYEKAIALDPTSAEGHYNLGLLYHTQNRYNEALEYYRKALQYYPQFVKAHYNMGAAYYQMKDYPQALKKFEEAFRYDSRNRIIQEKVSALRKMVQQ